MLTRLRTITKALDTGNNMDVKWNVLFADGSTMSGRTDDGSWRNVRSYVNGSKSPIVALSLNNSVGSASIDPNANGYFLGNKLISMLGQGHIEMVGIGYWKETEGIARILWCDPVTLQPSTTEARPTDECGFFLIKNPPRQDK